MHRSEPYTPLGYSRRMLPTSGPLLRPADLGLGSRVRFDQSVGPLSANAPRGEEVRRSRRTSSAHGWCGPRQRTSPADGLFGRPTQVEIQMGIPHAAAGDVQGDGQDDTTDGTGDGRRVVHYRNDGTPRTLRRSVDGPECPAAAVPVSGAHGRDAGLPSGRPVFVDVTGRRGRTWRRAGTVTALCCACYATTVGIALVGGDSSAPFLHMPRAMGLARAPPCRRPVRRAPSRGGVLRSGGHPRLRRTAGRSSSRCGALRRILRRRSPGRRGWRRARERPAHRRSRDRRSPGIRGRFH